MCRDQALLQGLNSLTGLQGTLGLFVSGNAPELPDEIWFGIITRQAIRRGSFGSLRSLIDTINVYIADWNRDAKPFTWTAKPKEIIAKVRVLQRDYKKLLANNSK